MSDRQLEDLASVRHDGAKDALAQRRATRAEIQELQCPFHEAQEAARNADEQHRVTELQAQEQARVDVLTADLRRGYFAVPGVTEEGFQEALPQFLEARRRDAALRDEDPVRAAQAGLYRSF
jgi:hypothetical protein